jgi:pimeloyl-ACP methyl ester carboxylesterase
MQTACVALLDRIGKKVILLGHSQGGTIPFLMADLRPKLVHSVVVLEPAGPPFIESALNGGVPARAWGMSDIPLTYSPPVADPNVDIVKKILLSTSPGIDNCTLQADSPAPRKLINLAKIPVLVVTAEASWHVGYDWCTVAFLNQAGMKTDQIALSDRGIHGNGHMMFLETNSDDIAKQVVKWIETGR